MATVSSVMACEVISRRERSTSHLSLVSMALSAEPGVAGAASSR